MKSIAHLSSVIVALALWHLANLAAASEVSERSALSAADVVAVTSVACTKPNSVGIERLKSGRYRARDTHQLVKYADVICKIHASKFDRPSRRLAWCFSSDAAWECRAGDYIDVAIGTDTAYLRSTDAPIGLEIFAYLSKYRWFQGDDIAALARGHACDLTPTAQSEWKLHCGQSNIWLGRFCPAAGCRFEVFGISPDPISWINLTMIGAGRYG
jgi:hypothetical protein